MVGECERSILPLDVGRADRKREVKKAQRILDLAPNAEALGPTHDALPAFLERHDDAPYGATGVRAAPRLVGEGEEVPIPFGG